MLEEIFEQSVTAMSILFAIKIGKRPKRNSPLQRRPGDLQASFTHELMSEHEHEYSVNRKTA